MFNSPESVAKDVFCCTFSDGALASKHATISDSFGGYSEFCKLNPERCKAFRSVFVIKFYHETRLRTETGNLHAAA